MNKNTRLVCLTALGIALYAVLSFFVKLPIVGHIGFDLGYIALAVYAYYFGPVVAAIVGGCGCVLVSLLAYGWFPLGWLLGNILIGLVCGKTYAERNFLRSFVVTVVAVFIGICGVKTIVECLLFSIPVAVKLPKNTIAALVDAAVMTIGLCIAPRIKVGDRLARA